MKELELLGLGPDGESITLNDADGNRYSLPITDALRASVRRNVSEASEPREMTPREIQTSVREGMSLAEVCEIATLPTERVAALAHPILAEREYTAIHARSFPINDAGGLTIEELVASRLLSRGVAPSTITWDAFRKKGEPWTLVAIFVTGDREHRASWHVDLDRRSLAALDDEGAWLSETQLQEPQTTWRAANTPAVESSAIVPTVTSTHGVSGMESHGIADMDSRAATASNTHGPSESQPRAIDAMLDVLNSQRGTSQPMPSEREFEELESLDDAGVFDFEGAHTAQSAPEEAVDATILSLPHRSTLSPVAELPSAPSPVLPDEIPTAKPAVAEEAAVEPPILLEVAPEKIEKKPRRGARPSMPSWDEIVFGKKD